jgi:hypothetical protein
LLSSTTITLPDNERARLEEKTWRAGEFNNCVQNGFNSYFTDFRAVLERAHHRWRTCERRIKCEGLPKEERPETHSIIPQSKKYVKIHFPTKKYPS